MTARNDTNSLDKIEIHHRRQLSALMDGDLAADEARFLLRRLQHDADLSGCWDRWQLCGEVLRGRALAPAPAGFAERVAHAVAAEPVVPSAAHGAARRPRALIARWGGGALAASVALVALFMARQQSPQEVPAGEGVQIASASQAPAAPVPNSTPEPAPAAPDAEAYAAAAIAVASVPRRQDNAARRSATRSQQAARSAQRVARAEAPVRVNAPPVAAPAAATALAATPPLHASSGNPFAHAASQDAAAPQARPWPRSALSAYPSAAGAFSAGFSGDSAARAFYPFEPRLPATPPVAPPEPQE